jgi:hypothetical protein
VNFASNACCLCLKLFEIVVVDVFLSKWLLLTSSGQAQLVDAGSGQCV